MPWYLSLLSLAVSLVTDWKSVNSRKCCQWNTDTVTGYQPVEFCCRWQCILHRNSIPFQTLIMPLWACSSVKAWKQKCLGAFYGPIKPFFELVVELWNLFSALDIFFLSLCHRVRIPELFYSFYNNWEENRSLFLKTKICNTLFLNHVKNFQFVGLCCVCSITLE